MRLLDGINDTEDEIYSFDATMSMKKKLDNKTIEDAFDDIKLICDNAQFDEEFSIYEEYLEQFDTVESALNDLYERREMMQRFNEASVPSIIDDDTYKKAKAFDIIKENALYVDWVWLFDCVVNNKSYEDYEEGCNATKETTFADKEEYDLFKEVLL